MAKALFALEDLEGEVIEGTPNADATTDAGVLELERVSTEADDQAEAIEEAEDTRDTVENIITTVGKTEDEGMSPELNEVVAVSIEHFCKRIGYGTKRLKPAFEGYSLATRVASTKLALEQLNDVKTTLDRQLVAAQEGFLDTVKHKFSLLFTNETKLLSELREVSALYDQRGPSEDDIENPPFGKTLNAGNKSVVTAKDVSEDLKYVKSRVVNEKLISQLKEIAGHVDALTAAMRNTIFASNKKDIETIEGIDAEMQKVVDDVEKDYNQDRKRNLNGTFKPVDSKSKDHLVDQTNELLTNASLSAAVNKLQNSLYSFGSEYQLRVQSRLIGVFAEDLRKCEAAVRKANDVYYHASYLVGFNQQMCHSVVAYIRASVRKMR